MISKDDVPFGVHALTTKKGVFFFLVPARNGLYADKEQTQRIQQQPPDKRASPWNLMKKHWLQASRPSVLNSCYSESVATADLKIFELRDKVRLSNVGTIAFQQLNESFCSPITDNQT